MVEERDSFSANLLQTKQTSMSDGAFASPTTTVSGINVQWQHRMRPDVTLSAALSYAVQDGLSAVGAPGNSTSIAASAGVRYQISDTVSASLRYSFFERRSDNMAYSFYQNVLILG